jgi:hypothetical protein
VVVEDEHCVDHPAFCGGLTDVVICRRLSGFKKSQRQRQMWMCLVSRGIRVHISSPLGGLRRLPKHIGTQNPLVPTHHLVSFMQHTPTRSNPMPVKQHSSSFSLHCDLLWPALLIFRLCLLLPSTRLGSRTMWIERRPSTFTLPQVDQYCPAAQSTTSGI